MLEERGWTHNELALITGRTRQTISSIIAGRTGVTPDTAKVLGAAFGNSAEEWLRLGAQYELAIAQADTESVSRMARCFNAAPVREMWKRGWVRETTDPKELESELATFFGQSLNEPIEFPVAARNGVAHSALNVADRAWCFRARQLARAVPVPPYSESSISAVEKKLRRFAAFAQEARKLALVLAEHGIRLVVVELIPGSQMDGAAFWLDEQSPVIALSLRHDRIDSFWFTLMHEWFHIRNRDSYSFDTNLLVAGGGGIAVSTAVSEAERIANVSAADFLVPCEEIESFVRRLAPIFSRERIIQFANKVRIHPGIIVGQLQHRGALGYAAHREFLVKIRDFAKESAFTDGFGDSIHPDILSGGTSV